jgi:hypothetical protein
MRHLLRLFEIMEGYSCRGLPHGIQPGRPAPQFYETLLRAVLDGDEIMRVFHTALWRGKAGGDPDRQRVTDLSIPLASYFFHLCEADQLVRDLLQRIPNYRGDDATYRVALPPGLTRQETDAIAAALKQATASCAPTLRPADVDQAWRRVLSEEAARRGIRFAALRPDIGFDSEVTLS